MPRPHQSDPERAAAATRHFAVFVTTVACVQAGDGHKTHRPHPLGDGIGDSSISAYSQGMTFREFPHNRKPGTFSLDAVLQMLHAPGRSDQLLKRLLDSWKKPLRTDK